MTVDTLVEELAARLTDAAREGGKVRRLCVRQIEMYLRWRHDLCYPLRSIVQAAEAIANAGFGRARALEVAIRLLGRAPAVGRQATGVQVWEARNGR
jgi:hypothetical protein